MRVEKSRKISESDKKSKPSEDGECAKKGNLKRVSNRNQTCLILVEEKSTKNLVKPRPVQIKKAIKQNLSSNESTLEIDPTHEYKYLFY